MINGSVIPPYTEMQMIMSRQPAGSASKENERPRPRPQHVPQRPTLSLTPERWLMTGILKAILPTMQQLTLHGKALS